MPDYFQEIEFLEQKIEFLREALEHIDSDDFDPANGKDVRDTVRVIYQELVATCEKALQECLARLKSRS